MSRRTCSERVYQMMKGFMDCHKKGMTISEIANIFGVSSVTVYKYLEEIAKQNELKREDLLQVVKTSPSHYLKKEAETFNVDVGKVLAEIDDVKAGISRAISEIDVIIMKCEESEQ